MNTPGSEETILVEAQQLPPEETARIARLPEAERAEARPVVDNVLYEPAPDGTYVPMDVSNRCWSYSARV